MANGIEQVTGGVLLVLGIAFALNPAFWGASFKRLLSKDDVDITLFLVLLVLGLIVIRGHNLWVFDWRVVVTIAGWGMLLKSAAVLLVPRLMSV